MQLQYIGRHRFAVPSVELFPASRNISIGTLGEGYPESKTKSSDQICEQEQEPSLCLLKAVTIWVLCLGIVRGQMGSRSKFPKTIARLRGSRVLAQSE